MTYDPYFQLAEQMYGLPPGLLSAIAAQENVDPRHNNPLGLSTDSGVKSFSQEEAPNQIFRQAKLLTDPNGPYADFARTHSIQDLAKVYSPVGAANDPYGTNATETAGIMANMPGYSGLPTYAQVPQTSTAYGREGNYGSMNTLQDYYHPQPSATDQGFSALGKGLQSSGSSLMGSGDQSQNQALAMLQQPQQKDQLDYYADNPLAALMQLYQLTGMRG